MSNLFAYRLAHSVWTLAFTIAWVELFKFMSRPKRTFDAPFKYVDDCPVLYGASQLDNTLMSSLFLDKR